MPVPVVEEVAAWAGARCGVCIVYDLIIGIGHNPRPADHEPIYCPTLSEEGSRQYHRFRRAIKYDRRSRVCYTCHVGPIAELHPPYRTLRDICYHPYINIGASIPWAVYRNESLRALARAFVEQSHGVTLPSWDSADLFAKWLASDPNVLSPSHRIAYTNSMMLVYLVWWLSSL
ncbi:hypothetical protein GGG16DRAFT_66874 [Schizophyllum commune]